MRYRIHFHILLIFFGIELIGQADGLASYDFEFITHEEGNYINCRENIYMDSTGMLWVATPNSLLLYDGNSITSFSKEDPFYKLDIPNIQLFNRTSEGNFIIVSSDNYFYIFNPYTKQIIHKTTPTANFRDVLENTLSSDQTGSIFVQNNLAPDNNNGYYALLKGMDKMYYIFYSHDGSDLVLKKTFSIEGIPTLIYTEGELFISNKMSVLRLDTSMTVINQYDLSLSRQQTPFIYKDEENTIWAYENCTSDDCQLFKLENNSGTFLPLDLPEHLNLKGIHKIRHHNGFIWFFGVGKLIQLDLNKNQFQDIFPLITKSFESLESAPLISHYTSVMADKNKMIWLSSGYGLVQLIPQQDAYQLLLRSDPSFCNGFCSMRGIASDKKGTLWFASYSGLLNYSPDGVISKVHELDEYLLDGIYSLSILDPFLLVNDLLYNMETGETEELIVDKQNRHVTNAVGTKNDFWIATCYEDGNNIALYHYELSSKKLTTIDIPDSVLRSGQITDLVLSRDGENLWITTALSGTLQYTIKEQQFKSITPPQYWDVEDTRHFCVYEISDNQLFIGTSRSLLELDVTTSQLTEYKKILDSDKSNINRNIFSILPETDSVLWLGSDKGVLNFNLHTKKFTGLSQFGKLGTEEFNRESSFKRDNGDMIFGSVNGIYIIDPDKLISYRDEEKPRINLISAQHYDGTINDMIISQSKTDTGHSFQFEHNDKMVSFNMSMPEFRPNHNTYYSYFLEGFQETWSIPNEENIIRFTNLDPGQYTLHVKAGYDINNLVSDVLSIKLTISDAWYNATWFKLLVLLCIIAFLFSLLLIRYNQLLKYQELRSEISKNLHDDVGSMLTGIAMQSEMMEKLADENIKGIARSIAQRSREAMSSMRDTVWAIDSDKDTTMDLKDRILDYIQDTLYSKDISYSIKSNITTTDVKIMPHIRQHIYLITKESINNIVKHSNTDKVEISLNINKKNLSLIIKDFGSAAKIKRSGQGIKNMKQRAESLGGTYHFAYDNGYTTTVLVPVK